MNSPRPAFIVDAHLQWDVSDELFAKYRDLIYREAGIALTDQKNLAPDGRIAPIHVGLLVVLIGMTFGFNAGYAINPARDLGPRLFTALAGWGGEVFTAGNSWWWVPIVGPLIGGVLGGYVYDLCITRHRPK